MLRALATLIVALLVVLVPELEGMEEDLIPGIMALVLLLIGGFDIHQMAREKARDPQQEFRQTIRQTIKDTLNEYEEDDNTASPQTNQPARKGD